MFLSTSAEILHVITSMDKYIDSLQVKNQSKILTC